MVAPWRIVFTKRARKDVKLLSAAGLRARAEQLFAILGVDPYESPRAFEKLIGDLAGAYSRRISLQHRLVYEVLPAARTVKVPRMWTHYE